MGDQRRGIVELPPDPLENQAGGYNVMCPGPHSDPQPLIYATSACLKSSPCASSRGTAAAPPAPERHLKANQWPLDLRSPTDSCSGNLYDFLAHGRANRGGRLAADPATAPEGRLKAHH